MFTHFAKPGGLTLTQMHCKRWVEYVVSFSRRIQALFKHYKQIFGKTETILQRQTSFCCQRIVSGNTAKVAKIPCHTKLVTHVSN